MFKIMLGFLQRYSVNEAEVVTQDVIAMCHGMVDAAISAGERDFNAISMRLRRAVLSYVSTT